MNAIRFYKKTDVTTADPLRLVVMLYDGFLKYGFAALDSMKKKRPADTGKNLGRALPILQELQSSLNHEVAPELSGNLDALYTFVQETIMQAHVREDAESMEQALCIIAELRDGWGTLQTGAGRIAKPEPT